MKNIKIKNAYWMEGDLYEVAGEGEMMTLPRLHIVAEAEDGTEYMHHAFLVSHKMDEDTGFNYWSRDAEVEAEARADRVIARGFINLDYWDKFKTPSYSMGEVDEVDLMDEEERAHYSR